MIKWILIASFTLKEIYDMMVTRINDRYMEEHGLPENVRDVYDIEEYSRWQSYHKEHSRVSLVENIVSLLVSLILLASNAFAAIFGLFTGMNIFAQYALFIAVTMIMTLPITVTASYYRTFVIEEKYGMNKTTKRHSFLMR